MEGWSWFVFLSPIEMRMSMDKSIFYMKRNIVKSIGAIKNIEWKLDKAAAGDKSRGYGDIVRKI